MNRDVDFVPEKLDAPRCRAAPGLYVEHRFRAALFIHRWAEVEGPGLDSLAPNVLEIRADGTIAPYSSTWRVDEDRQIVVEISLRNTFGLRSLNCMRIASFIGGSPEKLYSQHRAGSGIRHGILRAPSLGMPG